MKAKIQRWGNSLALRIPNAFAKETRLERDTEVELRVADGGLIIQPLPHPAPTLEQLLARVTPENLHGETETGEPVGREVW